MDFLQRLLICSLKSLTMGMGVNSFGEFALLFVVGPPLMSCFTIDSPLVMLGLNHLSLSTKYVALYLSHFCRGRHRG